MPSLTIAGLVVLALFLIAGRFMLSKWRGSGGARIAIQRRWVWFSSAELIQIRQMMTSDEQAIVDKGMHSEEARLQAMEAYSAVVLRWLQANPTIASAKGITVD